MNLHLLAPVLLLTLAACQPTDLYPLENPPIPPVLDQDGDGFTDDLEMDLGSDPENPYSWDFDGGVWPDFSALAEADGVTGSGYGIGDVIPRFRGEDQHGGVARLYQFYSYVVILDFVAGWCPPCDTVAQDAQPWWVEVREEGILVVHVVVDDFDGYGAIDAQFPSDWASRHGLEFPVLLDDTHEALEGFEASGLYEFAIPFTVVLDAELRIDSAYTGESGAHDAQLRALELR